MGTVKITNYYDEQPITSATTQNANQSAITASTGALNEENIRIEGIDFRNLNTRGIRLFGTQYNDRAIATGQSLPTLGNGALYYPFSSSTSAPSGIHPGGELEHAVNHDNTGVINTAAGKGTKLQLNGSSGIGLQVNDKVVVRWSAMIYAIIPGTQTTNIDHLMSTLIAPGVANNGSGIGEWFWILYPKFNTTSNALNDNDFNDANGAGLVNSELYLNPDNDGAGAAKSSLATHNTNHMTVIPLHLLSAGNATGQPDGANYADVNGPSEIAVNNHFKVSGEFSFTVDQARTLYGVQLFTSGVWRFDFDPTGTTTLTPSVFLEPDVCDPANSDYGVDDGIAIERAKVDVIIYMGEMA